MTEQGNAATRLSGLTLDNDWVVGEMLLTGRRGIGSGGYFSVSYSVSKGNQTAFLKAFDIFQAMERAVQHQQSVTTVMLKQLQAYEFETELHRSCLKMKRIVRILDQGQKMVTPLPNEQFSTVPYMIMELADGGDVRSYIQRASAIDLAMKLYYLRDVASGLLQLHSANIAHQDLKPSNIMIFNGDSAKIGDLGRASQQQSFGLHDALTIAGDRGYAPPEQTYGVTLAEWIDRRQKCDLYQFGSLISFLIFGTTINAALKIRIPREILPPVWGGGCQSYEQALPFLEQAFNEVLMDWKNQLPDGIGSEIIEVIQQCSNPDYRVRGSRKTMRQSVPNLGIDRFVSQIDRLATKASIQARTKAN